MNDTRYGHSNVGGGTQDQGERKDEGWESRQGGDESRQPGRRGDGGREAGRADDRDSSPPPGTNTQGELAGIGDASRETREELERMWQRGFPSDDGDRTGTEDATPASGTDQPRRMGGPLGPDPTNPHLPEGAQNPDTQGTGAGGFDRGVNATQVGAVHQGVKVEDPQPS